MKLPIKLLQLIIFIVFVTKSSMVFGFSLIRDSQTEDLLKKITRPLIKAANLNQDDLQIYIVNDSAINAFVMAGQNIFINTGLIIKYEDPNILTGVIAHEVGHIAGGHLARGHEAMKDVNKVALLSYLAGIAAAITANGDAGYAVLMGSNHIAQRLAVKHTRTQEEAADKLALEYLKEVNDSPVGLMKLLTYFNSQESQYKDFIDEYALTHPVSQKRINYIKANLGQFSEAKKVDDNIAKEMKYVIAKITAFTQDSNESLKYFNSDSSFDKYARSIAYFKKGKLNRSLFELNKLIKEQPKNGYFHELKGQILFENNLIKESIQSYKKAINLLPSPDLAKIALSGSILSLKSNDRDLINFAIKSLNEASVNEKDNGQLFKELARAYQKIGEMGKSYLALSELNLLRQKNKKARQYAKMALENLSDEDKSSKIKAQDILAIIEEEKEEKLNSLND